MYHQPLAFDIITHFLAICLLLRLGLGEDLMESRVCQP